MLYFITILLDGHIMGSRDRNHSSNATGDISVTTRSEERKRCSFNAYLYNQPTGSATYKSEEAMASPSGFNEG
ncbi:hypothetical protein Bca4012_052408 [Brassica carinata]